MADWIISDARTTIEAGQTVTWWFNFGGDPGMQIIEARPIPEETGGFIVRAPAELKTSGQTLKMELEGYTYSLTVTHVSGWSPTKYVLVGKRIG